MVLKSDSRMNVSIVIHHFRQILGSVLAMSTTELNGFFLSDAVLVITSGPINCSSTQIGSFSRCIAMHLIFMHPNDILVEAGEVAMITMEDF